MRLRSRFLFRIVAILIVTQASIAAAQVPDTRLDAALPLDSQVTMGRLENGLTYYIRPNGRPEERAELRLVVNVGSVLEEDDQRGLAHLLEHMGFNGTRNFEQQELVEYLESIGMRFGPDLNAYTSFDETVYMLTVPTDDAEIVSTAFQILADWAGGMLLDPAEVDRERGVVIEEWRARRGAGARVQDEQFPVMFQGSRYAERLPIGEVEVLQNFPHETLVRFYERWYRPDLMAVVAVGDFNQEEIERLIRERFADLERPSTAADRPRFEVPGHSESRFHVMADPELTATQLQVLGKRPHETRETVADYEIILIERLYSSMLNARFQEIVQRPDAPFLAAGSGSGSLVRTTDAFILQAIAPDGGAARALEAVLTESERVARHGFTETELERQKLNLLRSLERAHTERDRTNSAVFANEYVSHFLSETPAPGIEFEYAVSQTLLPRITLDRVNAVARELLSEENRVVLVSGPQKPDAELPSEGELRQIFAGVTAAAIEPYEDSVVDQALLAVIPQPGPVVSEQAYPEVDVVEWHLANGVRVLIKQTDFREDEVLFRAFRPGGHSLASDDEFRTASMAATFASLGGVGAFSQTDLQRVLAGRAVSISPSIGELEEGLSGSSSPRDLETLLQLAHLYFTSPRYDEAASTAMLQQMRAVLANRGSSPATAFADTFNVVFTQGHPRALPVTIEDIDRLDPAEAFEFFRDRFADATDFTFVFVGNLDARALRPLVETYLGSLPTAGSTSGWRDVGIRRPPGVVEKVVRQGLEPQASTRIVFWGAEEYSRRNVNLLRSVGDILNVRLRDKIREELGGTYGVQVTATTSSRPVPGYALHILFTAAPERLDELASVVFEEVERLKAEGPDAQEVANIKEMQRRERQTSIRTNGFWINQIVAYEQSGLELPEIMELEALLAEITPESLQEAARRWLRVDNYVRVSLLPAP